MLTHKEFYIWLEGYLHGKLENKNVEIGPIVKKMGEVKEVKKMTYDELKNTLGQLQQQNAFMREQILKAHTEVSLKMMEYAFKVLENDKYWKESLLNTNRLLKPGGMMLITCASTGRPEYGTRRTDEFSSPLTAQAEGWEDYYMNITEADIKSVWNVEDIFAFHYFEYNAYSCDLYFYGIKK